MLKQLDQAERVRLTEAVPSQAQAHKAAFGQFMTPAHIAQFMVSLFPPSTLQTCRLLDAGAGKGALLCAFLNRWTEGGFGFTEVEATAYEIDAALCKQLAEQIVDYNNTISRIIAGDYIALSAVKGLHDLGYTHAILNPPYKKINSHSAHRLALRSVGIETVNLYSAFVALAVAQAAPSGQIVAIIPRSFCNGPYYRPFRDFILKRAAIRHIHLFASRSKTFKADNVLQENIIIRLERDGRQGSVMISTSTDDSFSDLITHQHPFERIIFPDDVGRFIHVPTSMQKNVLETMQGVRCALPDVGVKISTGPVVDFRLREHLRAMPERGTVPLLYPSHFGSKGAKWPIINGRKPNAIVRNAVSEKWLYPVGYYCVVRRFSSKEEKRRIVAHVVEPSSFGNAPMLGFENHLNVFHENKHGLPKDLAYGLALFLNTTAVDEQFRRFNGHTQVNATDLKLMKYPSRDVLMEFGKFAIKYGALNQSQIDKKLETLMQ